jgi:hypothetical protein
MNYVMVCCSWACAEKWQRQLERVLYGMGVEFKSRQRGWVQTPDAEVRFYSQHDFPDKLYGININHLTNCGNISSGDFWSTAFERYQLTKGRK